MRKLINSAIFICFLSLQISLSMFIAGIISKPAIACHGGEFAIRVVSTVNNDVTIGFSPNTGSGAILIIESPRLPGGRRDVTLPDGALEFTITLPDGGYTAKMSAFGCDVSNQVGFSLPNIIVTPTPPPGVGAGNLGRISPPPGLSGFAGGAGTQSILRVIIQLLFIVGFVAAFFCILISAISWIISGGDKAGIQQAKGRITACIVGLVIMLSIFAIVNIIELVFGVNIFSGGLEIPRL